MMHDGDTPAETARAWQRTARMGHNQLRDAANLLRDGSARAAGDGTGMERVLREAARFVDRVRAGATVAEAVATTPRVTEGTAKAPDLPPLTCPRAGAHEGHTWPATPTSGGRVYWCTGVPPDKPAPSYGTSDAYPSPAARYGTEMLMAMAGTLAERAEKQMQTHVPSETAPHGDASVGLVYAVLALTDAVRDLPEQIATTLPQALAQAIDADE